MTIYKYNFILLILLFSAISLPLNAGQLYRYLDNEGITTISKILPPYAAQKGYDILNDTSLQLIKNVPPALTSEQIAEQQEQQAEQEEMQRIAEASEKKQQELNAQKSRYDQALLDSYQSEQDLLKIRDTVISHHEVQIKGVAEQLTKNKQKLHKLQQQAAEQELSGHNISDNLKKRLSTIQTNIEQNKNTIEYLQLEKQQFNIQYKEDLTRLKQLLSKNN